MMSATNSGGVSSIEFLTASTMALTGPEIACRNFLARHLDGSGQARADVASPKRDRQLLLQRARRAYLDFRLLCHALANQKVVLAPHVMDDHLVHLVPRDPDRVADDHATERDDGDLGRAPADVDDHIAGGLLDGQARPDGGGHRLLDEVRLARPRVEGRLLDRALLDFGHAAGDADDDDRPGREEVALVDALDEMFEHALDDVKVGDDAVFERADRLDVRRRAADHALRFQPDGQNAASLQAHRHDRRLRNDDAFLSDVDERVRRAEIDAENP